MAVSRLLNISAVLVAAVVKRDRFEFRPSTRQLALSVSAGTHTLLVETGRDPRVPMN